MEGASGSVRADRHQCARHGKTAGPTINEQRSRRRDQKSNLVFIRSCLAGRTVTDLPRQLAEIRCVTTILIFLLGDF